MAATGGEVKRRLTLFGLPNSTKLRHRFGVRTGFEPVQQNLQLGELEPNFRFKFIRFGSSSNRKVEPNLPITTNCAWAKLSGLPAKEIGRCERALGDTVSGSAKCPLPPPLPPALPPSTDRSYAVKAKARSTSASSSSSHSPILLTPGLSYSPSSTGSLSGDCTIQMSSFMDDFMAPAAHPQILQPIWLDLRGTRLFGQAFGHFSAHPRLQRRIIPMVRAQRRLHAPAEFLHEGLRAAAAAPWSLTVEGCRARSAAQPLAATKRGPLNMALAFGGVLLADDISGPPGADAGLWGATHPSCGHCQPIFAYGVQRQFAAESFEVSHQPAEEKDHIFFLSRAVQLPLDSGTYFTRR
ncbi:hypothetical protein C8J57DRAFT_1225947 [Mycena rebaudengoi]|nr:hypothetical protein C8J57DRAFT_1225947 [Mycena rebaudengoi]